MMAYGDNLNSAIDKSKFTKYRNFFLILDSGFPNSKDASKNLSKPMKSSTPKNLSKIKEQSRQDANDPCAQGLKVSLENSFLKTKKSCTLCHKYRSL